MHFAIDERDRAKMHILSPRMHLQQHVCRFLVGEGKCDVYWKHHQIQLNILLPSFCLSKLPFVIGLSLSSFVDTSIKSF
jgi:hypothetical protein